MSFMISLIKLIAAIGVLGVIAGVYQTIKSQSSSNPYQQQFLGGSVASGLPDGPYQGSADFYVFGWKGKRFDKANASGVNIIGEGAAAHDKYPFTLSIGKGIRDADTQAIKLDYDRPENPFWLRPTLDEMTETAPGKYIGKIHYRLIPYFPFTISYFRIER